MDKRGYDLRIGPIRVPGIYFGFFDGQLTTVYIVARLRSIETIYAIAKAKQGQPISETATDRAYERGDTGCLATSEFEGQDIWADNTALMVLVSKSLLVKYRSLAQTPQRFP